jgi:hypothetical protein
MSALLTPKSDSDSGNPANAQAQAASASRRRRLRCARRMRRDRSMAAEMFLSVPTTLTRPKLEPNMPAFIKSAVGIASFWGSAISPVASTG